MYIDALATRLATDGCTVTTESWNGVPVLVGHRADFRLRWMATKLHQLTIVAPTGTVSAGTIEQFTEEAFTYAVARKGQMRGLQSGIAIFPTLVGTAVDPAAAAWARQQQRLRFACMARPVTVDVSTGEVAAFRGRAALGALYAGHLRTKIDTYFPVGAGEGTRGVNR
jgi:predicted deacetylase